MRSGLRVKHLLRNKPSRAPNGALPGSAAGRKTWAALPSVPAGGAAHAAMGAGDGSAAEGGAVAVADCADAPAPAEAATATAYAAGSAGHPKARGKQRSKRDYAAWAAATPESRAAASQQYMGAGGSGKPAAEGAGEAQAPGQGPNAQSHAPGQPDAASTANGAPLRQNKRVLQVMSKSGRMVFAPWVSCNVLPW